MNGTHDNDNSDPWKSIGWQADMILNRLRNERALLELAEEKKEQPGEQPKAGNENENRSANHREAVNQRLRDLAAFERRARGVK